MAMHYRFHATSSLQCFDTVEKQEGYPACKNLGVSLLVVMI